MKTRFIFLLLFLSLCGRGTAQWVWDDLSTAMDRTGNELAQGKDRSGIRDRLENAIKNNPKSPHLDMAKRLSADLLLSLPSIAGTQGIDNPIPLMETKIPFHLVSYSPNWEPHLEEFLAKNPSDPMAKLLLEGRGAIDSLLSYLEDSSPTHSYNNFDAIAPPRIPRVCDLALVAIEFHSKARFRSYEDNRKLFHELPTEKRMKTIRRLEKWWAENKHRSTSAGIRAQLPHADSHTKIWMAENLASLGAETAESDREDALELLRSIVRNGSRYTSVHAARTLAKLGDFSPVEVFHGRLARLSAPSSDIYSGLVFYLTDYGVRREWELLHKLAAQEIERGLKPGMARIWPTVVNSRKARTSPLAIPGLALTLTQTEPSGSRYVEGAGSAVFSVAEIATENLQSITKIDFGYRWGTSMEQRMAAVEKAQEWWLTQGRQKYTFDYVETLAGRNGHT